MVDVINVKTYGATGNGSTDDRANIQSAFDAAFGTAASPHGIAGKYSNLPVYFPPGKYMIGAPGLTLTDVAGGWLYGMGSITSLLQSTGSGHNVINVNGMINTRFERLGINGDTIGNGLELSTASSSIGSIGLNSNIFSDMSMNGLIGCQIASNGNDGARNLFINCTVGYPNTSATGLKIVGTNATGNVFISGGADMCAIGIHVAGGQMANVIGASFGISTTQAIKVDNSSNICVHGGRTEGTHFLDLGTGRAHMCGISLLSYLGHSLKMATGGVAIMEACYFGGPQDGGFFKYIEGAGTLFLRGNYYRGDGTPAPSSDPSHVTDYTSVSGHTFTGTIAQNI